jgi:hypothetical protein
MVTVRGIDFGKFNSTLFSHPTPQIFSFKETKTASLLKSPT